jgi:lysophospholipase L1-like esterase
MSDDGAMGIAQKAKAAAANPFPGIFNYNPLYLFRWRAAMAKVKRGTARAKILSGGDSKTFGRYAMGNTNLGYTNARVNGYPPQLAALLTARGLPAENDNFYTGNYLSTANMLLADPRVTVSGSWTVATSTGNATSVYSSGTSAGSLIFAPGPQFDTADVYYFPNNTNPFTISIDGAVVATITPVVTGSMAKATVSTTLGTHTISVDNAAGSSNQVQGIDTYVNAVKSVSVFNSGLDGGTVPSYFVATANPYFTIPILKPDLTVLNYITNDIRAGGVGTAEATYKANLGSLIDVAKQNGDVILMPAPPMDTTLVDPARYLSFVQWNRDLAVQKSCVMLDLSATWPPYATSNAIGMFGDGLHENAVGYGEIARQLATLLLRDG